MTEKSQDTNTASGSSAPGAGAGDSAPTQAIPRIPKPMASKPSGSGASGAPKPDARTDKGRPRDIAAPSAPAASGTSTPAKPAATGKPPAPERDRSDAKPRLQPVGGPTGRPLTASDYARTTKQSASSTAVIPAVRDRHDRDRETAHAPAVSPNSGRRASLRLTHVEPWSVTRLAFAISVAMMIVAVVAAMIFWIVLDFAGVWEQINDSFTSVLSDDSSSFDVKDYFGFGRVVGLTLVLSAVNVVIATALATIGAHLYNLAAQLMGGVEVTFAEEK
ncbi:MAG: hypothetical protein JWQ91_2081 [Aeromicrobium sp.]|uniref:DUF3566 domain-containing protein n=1 Tax=Aeromicrobium sp. TaxID=1871063 RepID=UPI00261CCCFC|nr:DUF3566 domain-containing protein [Aeromicrobium sp.]MCW2825164.1 hypothetical protein [Aeromicrobium sp.]